MADEILSDLAPLSKPCKHCGENKPLSEFYISRRNGRHGPRCRTCLYKQTRAYTLAHPEKAAKWTLKSREKHAGRIRARTRFYVKENKEKYRELSRINMRRGKLRRMGITEEIATEAFKVQGGLCAICQVAPIPPMSGHSGGQLDHCHSTMRFRGILCFPCNTSIGKLDDDPERMIRAAAYVRGELYPWFSKEDG